MPLRLKDKSQFGREIDCPDCRTRLLIVADAGEVRAQRAVGARGLERPRRPGSKTMLRVIWVATACLGGMVVWLAARPDAASLATATKPTERVGVEESSAAPAPVGNPATPPPVAEVVAEAVQTPDVPPLVADLPPLPAPVVDDKPLQPDLAPDPPAVDVAAQLAQRIAEYSQTKPVQVRLLLRHVAELSAVPVDLSAVEVEPWKAKLDQAIKVELKGTTVGGVLEEVLKQAGLASRQRDGVILVVPVADGS